MSSGEILERIASEVRVCTKCPLSLSRTHAVPGEGPPDAAILIVGEGPGGSEDKAGRPFVGAAGRNLDRLLEKAGLSRARDVFITNAVKCRPPGNRKPATDELNACFPYLLGQLQSLTPRVVVLLGDTALKRFFPVSTLRDTHGKLIENNGVQYFPTYHPAAMIYNRSLAKVIEEDFVRLGSLVKQKLSERR